MDATSSPGNIGFPLDTVSAFVIQINEGQQDGQAKFQPVPVGEVGELAVGGYQLASSYINRAAQTAAVFVDTPWGRAYRTGDKARMRDDGTIECLGRISEGQVKLRGQRMELGEIEQAALRTPGCHGAVAAVISNVLVLFCAADEEPAVESKILKTCMAWLPRSMVPGDVVVAQEFPRLASGKVDRKRLIEQYASTSVRESQQAEARPLSPTERLLLESCRGILSKTVDPKTVLSTAGMDSLTAIKFVSDLRTRGLAVSVLDVLKSRTIAALAKTLDSTRLKPQTSGVRTTASEQDILKPEQCGLAHLKDSIQAILPCSSLQAAMLSETLRDSQAYCNWVELEFPSDYETAQIRNAFCSVFKRFEIYRTGFKIWDDRILQVIWKDFPSQQVTMVRKFDRAYQLETEDELLHPLKLQFLEGTESPRRVLLQLHHALYDGWSLDMLILDLDDCLNMRPAAPRIQFREMCGALQALHCGLDRDAEEEFWTSYLQGFQVPSSPVIKRDHPTDASMLSYAKSFSSSPREVEESMRWLEISPAVLFQAATLVVWSLIVGSSDTLIGTVTSGRTIDLTGVEETVGPCMETRPLRLDLKDVDSIEQLLDMVQSSNRSVIENTKISLQAIKRIQGVRPGQQLFDVLFVYQQSIFSDDARRSCVKVVGHQDHLESRLLVEVYEDGDKLICQLSADAAFIDEILLRKVADMIDSVTVHILRNPKSSVAALARCFPSGLLSISNPVPCRYTGSEDLARRVEAVAASHSQRPALSFLRTIGDRKLDIVTLSFGQLNATANRIASYVRSLQSNLGTVIGIVMEKSPALYASILAILKLGCAYLPLLPSTPTARVSSILSQAGVSICLVDSETQGKLRDVPNCLAINSADGDLSRHSEENICPPVDLESPSYVIYTSGTTGSPKGVLVSHRSVLSNIDALSRIYPFSPSSRMLQACSQAFDVSVFEIFFSWLNGICLCATTNDMLFSDIEGCINALGVTHLSMTTTVASLLKVERLQAVEFLVTSGEPMTESVFTSWVGRLYQGKCEVTVSSTK